MRTPPTFVGLLARVGPLVPPRGAAGLNDEGAAGPCEAADGNAKETQQISWFYQPIDEIRDYFGDHTALYFAWMGVRIIC